MMGPVLWHRGQHDSVLVLVIVVGIVRTFWLIYLGVTRVSGSLLQEAERLVVDVGVPAPVCRPARAAAAAAAPAAAAAAAPAAAPAAAMAPAAATVPAAVVARPAEGTAPASGLAGPVDASAAAVAGGEKAVAAAATSEATVDARAASAASGAADEDGTGDDGERSPVASGGGLRQRVRASGSRCGEASGVAGSSAIGSGAGGAKG
ncbi:hypothetical protein EMIHUDRAFT_359210 [Emiliania huxleyi CCMP1516]|uniref:Uncharacterized protein n=2 Tax=Emiliania huxleyi TaxID=2903 RepID=A0A0D3I843_EMIH1|nr:hypothetical protein EMIHUDRAFT_359210 [Emiliania huxleyi CCMP1516]EOD07428.1 hypothetical protein EMIHUDRAFT_359210 [Emiliania huxleyi CCMP1516]|eukprot:XP_005759857.1 hypothetical protein EMIHUDRAFT_359210 [Emiliania huxleyi CCMP1516]